MKISEFARSESINIETVRYYQRLGLMRVPPSGAGYRQYTAEDIRDLRFIKNAKSAGFSLEDIKYLKGLDSTKDRPKILKLSEAKKAALESKIQELKSAESFLNALVAECRSTENSPCPILETLKSRS